MKLYINIEIGNSPLIFSCESTYTIYVDDLPVDAAMLGRLMPATLVFDSNPGSMALVYDNIMGDANYIFYFNWGNTEIQDVEDPGGVGYPPINITYDASKEEMTFQILFP